MKNLKTSFLLVTIFLSTKSFSQTWTSHNAGTVNIITNVSFPKNDSGYAIDDQAQLHKTFDGATTWSAVSTPSLTTTICFISGMTGFVGCDSSIYKTSNAGSTWTEVKHDNRVSFVSIYFLDASQESQSVSYDFSVYPVPASSSVTISPDCTSYIYDISFTDVSGKNIITLLNETGIQTIDVSSWVAGVYFVTFKSGEFVERKKIIITKQ